MTDVPMHYPPLADGTYRYGDPPMPKPSPLPGPDPVPQGQHPWPGPHGPDQGPPAPGDENSRGERSPGTRTAMAIGGALGALAVVALGLAVFAGSDRTTSDPSTWPAYPSAAPAPSPGASAFPVRGSFVVTSTPGEPVSGDAESCSLPESLSDIGEGTSIRLLDPARVRLADAMLAYEGGDASTCTYSFDFDRVTAGESFYVVEIEGRGQLVYTEPELREGVDITLGR